MTNTIAFKHSGNTGDIIYALAGMKHICEKLGMQAKIYIWLDRKGYYYEGATHPLGEVTMNEYMYKMLKPLLLAQPWVKSVKKFAGQKIAIDLDLVRQRNVNMPYGHIARWYFYIWPDLACDISQPWLEVPEDNLVDWSQTVIVNRTGRYQNPHISYAFLRKHENVVFVGTFAEYQTMVKEVPNIRFVEFPNFLNLLFAIKNCKVFIGNQSMCYALAEAIKAPRILELCSFAPNCIPEGPGPGYDFYAQSAFEYYVEEMTKKLTKEQEAELVEAFKPWKEEKGIPLPKDYVVMADIGVGVPFDLSKGRFQQDKNGGWFCRKEDKDIIDNTLVDVPRLAKIEEYVKQTEGLPGMIAEVGVYRGGTSLLIKKTSNKSMYAIDTFEGMPKVDDQKDLHHTGDFADTSFEQVAQLLGFDNNGPAFHIVIWNGEKYENEETLWRLCHKIKIMKGKFPFSHPLPLLANRGFSFVHIDVDIYQSVKDCLEYFYPRMVQGGIICVDDYNEVNCPGAKQAFDEFMANKPESHTTANQFMDCQSQRAFVKL